MSIQQPKPNRTIDTDAGVDADVDASTTEPTTTTGPVELPLQTEEGEHAYLGLDKTGAMHHYAEHESRIIVIKGGDIQWVERFADADDRDLVVTEWLEFIENGPDDSDKDGRGWEEQPYMTQHQFWDEGARKGFQRLSEKVGVSER